MSMIKTLCSMKNLSRDADIRIPHDAAPEQENEQHMLREELESMTPEETCLKKIAAASALLVARLDRVSLPGGTAVAALALAGLIEGMPEDLMSEVMRLFKSS